MEGVAHFAPSAGLAPYVERVWAWAGDASRLPALLPGTGSELWIHRAAPPRIEAAGEPIELPQVHLVCLRRTRWAFVRSGPVAVTVVRLRAGAWAYLGCSGVDQVADRVVPAEALLPVPVRRLVAAANDGPQQVLGLLGGLLRPADERVGAAVRAAYADPAGLDAARIASVAGLSPRHLRRGFVTATGVGIKEFQRLARFQRTARELLLHRPERYLPTALTAGYYDQNHAVKEFRRLAGTPPGRMLRSTVSHFYYPPLPPPPDAGRHDHGLRHPAAPPRAG